MIRDPAAGVNARPTPRRFRPRPAPIPPTPPRSDRHRRHQLKVAYWRLAGVVERPVSDLVGMSAEYLLAEAFFGAAIGGRERGGMAFRLATKVLRLRPNTLPVVFRPTAH